MDYLSFQVKMTWLYNIVMPNQFQQVWKKGICALLPAF